MATLLALLLAQALVADGAAQGDGPKEPGRKTVFGETKNDEGFGYSLGTRVEGRATTTPPGVPDRTSAARALQVDVSAGVNADAGTWKFALSYLPRLTVNAPAESGLNEQNLVHNAYLSAAQMLAPLQRIRFEESFTYGRYDFSVLNPRIEGLPPPPVTYDPRTAALGVLAYISSTTGVGYDQAISARLKTTARVGYTLSGGADQIARIFLPLQHGVQFGSTTTWTEDRRDSFALNLNAAAYRLTTGSGSDLFDGSLAWTGTLDPMTTVRLSAGGGASRTSEAGQSGNWTPNVVASAGFGRDARLGMQILSTNAWATLSALVDPVNGHVYQLAEVHGSAAYTVVPDVRVAANGGASRSFNNAAVSSNLLVAWDAVVSWLPARNMALSLGARGAWQEPSTVPPFPGGTQWSGFASVAVGDHGKL